MMFHGEQLAREGMQRALDHAESEEPGWSLRAFEFLKAYALQHEYFPGYHVVMASELDRDFPKPPTSRAWGGVFRGAVAAGIIANSGKTVAHPHRHGCPAICWMSRIYGGSER